MDEQVMKTHAGYVWAVKELRRMVLSGAFDDLRTKRHVSRRIDNGGYSSWREAIEGWGHSWGLISPVSEYAAKLHAYIRQHRRGAASVDPYNPLAWRLRETAGTAHHALTSIAPRYARMPNVTCGKDVGMSVVNHRLQLCIAPTWLTKVHGRGIATPQVSGKLCLTVKATPKSSAFLAEDGITVFDAMVFVPTREGEVLEGFIFKSDGASCLFHSDFRLGANLIRRRVRNAVLDALLGEEKK